MSQSTKLFILLGFMFILFTTINGHLEQYLKIIFGKTAAKSSSSSNNAITNIFNGDLTSAASNLLGSIGFQ